MTERGGEKVVSKVFLVHIHALIHIKNQSVPTFLINTTLLMLCHPTGFTPQRAFFREYDTYVSTGSQQNELPDVKCSLVSSV